MLSDMIRKSNDIYESKINYMSFIDIWLEITRRTSANHANERIQITGSTDLAPT